jgi:catechol 2,3-dioxygenase-like lactoylglutathione lyase family enzyme
MTTKFLNSSTYLIVRNIDESAHFYRNTLGFNIVGYDYDMRTGTKFLCILERDAVFLLLWQAEAPWRPRAAHLFATNYEVEELGINYVCDCQIVVVDADAAYQEIMSKGARRVSTRTSTDPLRRFVVEDCNGYWIEFISNDWP